MEEKILLVDDDIRTIKYFKKKLEEIYPVFYYENAAEAIRSIENGLEYDLALFDVTLENQRVDCEDLINSSKRRNPDTPIMTLSAWTYNSPYIQRNLSKFHSAEHLIIIIQDYFKLNSR